MFSVYCHTSVDTEKTYVGITSQDPESRWLNGGGYSRNKKFYADIKKYGWERFEHRVISDGLTESQAVAVEQELISAYNSQNKGYNNCGGGKYVSKRCLCHEANQIKKGLKSCSVKSVAEWAELFEAAESAGADSLLCKNLNKHCQGIVQAMKSMNQPIEYGDLMWQVEFINALRACV